MKFSLKRKAVHARAREVATIYYIRRGYIPPLLAEFAEATASDEAFIKYSANQPRVPAGNPDGGQWTSEGGGGAETAPESQYPDAINPVYPIETILSALSGGSVISTIRCVLGTIARDAVGSAVSDAAAAIEDYFGGKPDRIFPNDAGDIIMMTDDKKIRFDINSYSRHKGPHFHIEELNNNSRWIDAGSEHAYPFKKE